MKYVGIRLDIAGQILEVVNSGSSDGATKNKLMYDVSLSPAQLNEYVMILTEKGLDSLRPRNSHT